MLCSWFVILVLLFDFLATGSKKVSARGKRLEANMSTELKHEITEKQERSEAWVLWTWRGSTSVVLYYMYDTEAGVTKGYNASQGCCNNL